MANTTPDPNDGRRAPGRAPNEADHERGWREGDPGADSIMPGRRFGAGDEVRDGPERSGGDPGKAG